MDPFDEASGFCGSRGAQNEPQEGDSEAPTSALIGQQVQQPCTMANRIDSANCGGGQALPVASIGGAAGTPLGDVSASSQQSIASMWPATSTQGQGISHIQSSNQATQLLPLKPLYQITSARRVFVNETHGLSVPSVIFGEAPIRVAQINCPPAYLEHTMPLEPTMPLDLSTQSTSSTTDQAPQFRQLVLAQNNSTASTPFLFWLPVPLGNDLENAYISEKSFYDLPNEIISMILEQFETHEKMLLRQVSQRFKGVIEDLLLYTLCLKLNFSNQITEPYHAWNPAVSRQSLQFDANWTQPTCYRTKTAKLTIRGGYQRAQGYFKKLHLSKMFAFFPNVRALVIYYDLKETQTNMKLIEHCIESFPKLTSFSMISAGNPGKRSYNKDQHSVLKRICDHLGQMDRKLTRLDLFLKPIHFANLRFRTEEQELNQNFLNVLSRLKHLGMIDYPKVQNIKPKQMLFKACSNEPQNLCIRIDDGLDNELLKSKPNLAHVQRLQLTCLDQKFQVQYLLKLCPNVKYLGLHYRNSLDELYFSNHHLNWIGRQSELTELAVFGLCFAKYELGHAAPNIRKLTIGMRYIFSHLFQADPTTNNSPKMRKALFEKHFVRIITCKFPSLDELTLINWFGPMTLGEAKIGEDIRTMLGVKLPKLKFTILDL